MFMFYRRNVICMCLLFGPSEEMEKRSSIFKFMLYRIHSFHRLLFIHIMSRYIAQAHRMAREIDVNGVFDALESFPKFEEFFIDILLNNARKR